MINILPTPKKIIEKEGAFHIGSCDVAVIGQHDIRVVRAAVKLRDALTVKTGVFHKFYRAQDVIQQAICIREDATLPKEGYSLEIKQDGIELIGGDAAGCFYGIQTLLQLLDSAEDSLVCVSIQDKPDMEHRGFYHDATRGRIPSLEGVKRIVDMLARFKVNSFQLYVEHSFDFAEFSNEHRTEEEQLTAQEILEIDEYCYNHFIDFIPSLSTFGHLYELLMKEEYRHLCELENFEPEWHFWRERMSHHTIDATNPESIQVVCSLIDQYLPLFRSQYFNICCDETFDLAKGRNAGKDSAQLYIGFVSQVAKYVSDAGKTVMMWGDIALEHPELLPQIPKDVVLLNWNYDAEPVLDNIVQVGKQSLKQIVCPGTNSWRALFEIPSISVPNITKMLRTGYENNAIGALNTNWGDYGHAAHFECALYGTVLGACLSWNIKAEVNEDFDSLVSSIVYGTNKNVVKLIKELGDLQLTARWGEVFEWQKLRTKDCFYSEENAMETSVTRCREIQKELMDIEGNQEILKAVLVAAEGIELFNMAALQIKRNGDTSEELKESFVRWLKGYKDCWLRTNKQSELVEIEKFIQNM